MDMMVQRCDDPRRLRDHDVDDDDDDAMMMLRRPRRCRCSRTD